MNFNYDVFKYERFIKKIVYECRFSNFIIQDFIVKVPHSKFCNARTIGYEYIKFELNIFEEERLCIA